jgi:predicted DNA-binding protein (MmcQ/YjbR family)
VSADPLPRLRRICLSFPETNERLSHGEPAWFIRDKKVFVTYADHHHDDRVGFWCAAPPGAQQAALAVSGSVFFRPPYVGHRGWLGVYLDVPIDWEMVEDVVEDAYRTVAPAMLIRRLEAGE